MLSSRFFHALRYSKHAKGDLETPQFRCSATWFTILVDCDSGVQLFTHMVERKDTEALIAILKAASNPTGRAILMLLAEHGQMRVTDIYARFDVSLNRISKHIKVLEQASPVTRRTEWRAHLIEVRPETLSYFKEWFASLRSIWALRLEALNHIFNPRTCQS